MACYSPLVAYRSRSGRDPKTGKWPIVFNVTKGYSDLEVKVPCNQCIGCRLERSRQWAVRCVHESSLYDKNCFVTLTYRDDALKYVVNKNTGEMLPSLYKRDMVLFLKTLRKEYGAGIRFFSCGEYGEICSYCGKSQKFCACGHWKPTIGRPHHHLILFNFDFPDKKYFTLRNKMPVYKSETLERMWKHGLTETGSCTFESAAYVARYITKKVTGDCADAHYCGRQPEYINMSRRPGIGRAWFEKNLRDVYNHDTVIIGRHGMKMRPPKYYDNLYDLQDSEDCRRIKLKRVRMAKLNTENNTWERLKVREQIQALKYSKLIRPLETLT